MARFLPIAFMALVLFLGACTTDIAEATRDTPIGDFRMERLVVVVDDPYSPPVSRKVDNAAIERALNDALQGRLGRFDGGGTHYIGVKAVGYVLAPRAVPILFAPRSQLFLNVIAYDGRQKRLNEAPLHLVVNERAGGDTFIGSGYTQTAEEQLAELAANAAIEIEKWLRENAAWFHTNGPDGSDSGA